MRKTFAFLALTALLAAPSFAGVVFEVETTDHVGSESEPASTQISAEGKLLKSTFAERGEQGEVIFRGDRREMVVVNHDDKSYFVIDDAMVESIGNQLNDAMNQMKEALKNVPEGQREMVEQMMKERMPQAAAVPERVKPEMRKTADRSEKNGYPSVRYEVLEGGKKVRELWVTDWKNVEGGTEVAESFKEMAGFFEELLDAFSSLTGITGDLSSQIDLNSFSHLTELDGFPVSSREFGDDGSLESESNLRSAVRRALDPAEFEPPAGYKRRQMFEP